MEAEFIACYEATTHALWLRKFILGLGVVDTISKPLKIYCDNGATIFFYKNDKYCKGAKHMNIKFFIVKEETQKQRVYLKHISTDLLIVDTLTKGLPPKAFKQHVPRLPSCLEGDLGLVQLFKDSERWNVREKVEEENKGREELGVEYFDKFLTKDELAYHKNENQHYLEDLNRKTAKLVSEMEELQKELKQREEQWEQLEKDIANRNANLSDIAAACLAVMLISYVLILKFASFMHRQEFSKGHKGVLVSMIFLCFGVAIGIFMLVCSFHSSTDLMRTRRVRFGLWFLEWIAIAAPVLLAIEFFGSFYWRLSIWICLAVVWVLGGFSHGVLPVSRFWFMLLPSKEYKIIVVGLDNAGKTTTLYKLHLGEVVTTLPTVDSNVEELVYKNIRFKGMCYSVDSFDLFTGAGHLSIDSTDRDRIPLMKEELFRLLPNEELQNAVLLVFANKRDLKDAMTPAEITDALSLHSIKNHGLQHSSLLGGLQ
ncbi:ADP-ribosylation factor-like protein 5 [Tanacetum coccineum]